MSVNSYAQNFAAGFNIGDALKTRSNERKASQAIGGYRQEAMGLGEEPFSTRKLAEAYTNVLETTANLGLKEQEAALEGIGEWAEGEYLKALKKARQYTYEGDTEAASQMIQRAGGFRPDFTTLRAAPTEMNDGSSVMAVELLDEQTGEPMAPSMLMPLDRLDELIGIEENEDWKKDNEAMRIARLEHQRKAAETNDKLMTGGLRREEIMANTARERQGLIHDQYDAEGRILGNAETAGRISKQNVDRDVRGQEQLAKFINDRRSTHIDANTLQPSKAFKAAARLAPAIAAKRPGADPASVWNKALEFAEQGYSLDDFSGAEQQGVGGG